MLFRQFEFLSKVILYYARLGVSNTNPKYRLLYSSKSSRTIFLNIVTHVKIFYSGIAILSKSFNALISLSFCSSNLFNKCSFSLAWESANFNRSISINSDDSPTPWYTEPNGDSIWKQIFFHLIELTQQHQYLRFEQFVLTYLSIPRSIFA